MESLTCGDTIGSWGAPGLLFEGYHIDDVFFPWLQSCLIEGGDAARKLCDDATFIVLGRLKKKSAQKWGKSGTGNVLKGCSSWRRGWG